MQEVMAKAEDIYNLRSPIDHKKLSIEKLIKASSHAHITKAKLISTSGHAFNVGGGIFANFVTKESVGGEALKALKILQWNS